MLRRQLTQATRAGRGMATFQPTKYGGKYTATLIPGDGIGKEVADSVKQIFSATNAPVEFEEVDVTGILAAEGTKDGGEQLYRKAVESIRRNKVGLKGILFTPLERSGHASFNVALRQELDLYASTVFIKNFPGLKTRHSGVDAVIIRENTEGEYSGLEQQAVPGVVEALKVITRTKSERIARFAFDFAQRNDRKKITVVHKANIMKLADGLFRDVFYETAKDYPEIQANDMIVDNASMQAVSKPQQFDVMLMPNLYGSILSNVMGGLVGGPGLIPGCNIGREYALFEPGKSTPLPRDPSFKDKTNTKCRLPTRRTRHQGQRPGEPTRHDPLVLYDAQTPRSRQLRQRHRPGRLRRHRGWEDPNEGYGRSEQYA